MQNISIMKYLALHLNSRQTAFINHFLHWKWFVLAFFVGSILNTINQFDGLFGRTDIDHLKLSLTYIVPYCVSSISSWYAMNAQYKNA